MKHKIKTPSYSIFLLALIVLISYNAGAQSAETVLGGSFPPEDSIRHYNLIEIDVVPPFIFKNKRKEKKYNQLERDLVAAYPLVKIVAAEFNNVNREFETVYTTKSQRKKYMKWFEKHIYNSYIDTLKTLSMGQARILLTLIARETGQSPYKLLKEYRGTGRAMMYRTGALLVGANLNATFDEEEDEMMAHILRRIENGELMPIEIEERYYKKVFEEYSEP